MEQAASGDDVTAADNEPAKQKRNKKPKSSKNALGDDHGAGIGADQTNDGAFVHIFVSSITKFSFIISMPE